MIGYSPLLVRRCWRSTRAAKKAGPTPPATTDSRRPPPRLAAATSLYTTRVLGSVVAIQPGTVGDPLTEWRYAPGETDFDTPTVVDGDAYIPGDRLHALSAATGEVRWTAPYDRQPASRPTGTGSTSRSMTGRWWRSTPRMAPSAGVSPLASEEGVFLRTRPLVTERSVIVTTEKPGLDEPANTFAVDRRNGEVRWQREQPGNIGYDAVAAGGRLYVPVLWDFTLDRERAAGH